MYFKNTLTVFVQQLSINNTNKEFYLIHYYLHKITAGFKQRDLTPLCNENNVSIDHGTRHSAHSMAVFSKNKIDTKTIHVRDR